MPVGHDVEMRLNVPMPMSDGVNLLLPVIPAG